VLPSEVAVCVGGSILNAVGEPEVDGRRLTFGTRRERDRDDGVRHCVTFNDLVGPVHRPGERWNFEGRRDNRSRVTVAYRYDVPRPCGVGSAVRANEVHCHTAGCADPGGAHGHDASVALERSGHRRRGIAQHADPVAVDRHFEAGNDPTPQYAVARCEPEGGHNAPAAGQRANRCGIDLQSPVGRYDDGHRS
jgi:hypothetical protein